MARLAIFAIAMSVAFAMAIVLRDGQIYGWEQDVVRAAESIPGRDTLFTVTDFLGDDWSPAMVAAGAGTVALLVVSRRRWQAAAVALVWPLHVAAQFPKQIIPRDRPSPAFDGVEGIGGPGAFPSGHSEFAVLFYGLLAWIVIRHLGRTWARASVIAGWLALVAAVGLGRMAGGRHWPLDVLGGWLIGLGLLSLLTLLADGPPWVRADRAAGQDGVEPGM